MVEKPIPVNIPGPVEYVRIPGRLLIIHTLSDVPDSITYGELIELWAADRASLDKANGQLSAIGSLQSEVIRDESR